MLLRAAAAARARGLQRAASLRAACCSASYYTRTGAIASSSWRVACYLEVALSHARLRVYLHRSAPARRQASEWIQRINSDVLGELRSVSMDHKYCVSTLVTENSGAGLHSFASAVADPGRDGQLSVVCENPSIRVIVTVFAAAL